MEAQIIAFPGTGSGEGSGKGSAVTLSGEPKTNETAADTPLSADCSLREDLRGLENFVRIISSAYDPSVNDDLRYRQKAYFSVGGDFRQYAVVVYDTPRKKREVIECLARDLPGHLPVLVEVLPTEPQSDYNILNYAARCSALPHGEKVPVHPVLSLERARSAARAVYPDNETYANHYAKLIYPGHPVIQAMLGLPADRTYQQELFRGRLPFLMVDSNPDNLPFCHERLKSLMRSQESERRTEAFNSYFHLASQVYSKDYDRLARAEAVPLLFLASADEYIALLHRNPFEADAATREIVLEDEESLRRILDLHYRK